MRCIKRGERRRNKNKKRKEVERKRKEKKREKEKGEERRKKEKKERRKKKDKIRLKAPALNFRAGFFIFSDLLRFPLGFRCLAENCMQFFYFFLQKASRFEKILHIKYEKVISQIAKNILCKLRNEVFTASEIRLNTKCSLTAREGISVPSLYVRVYRTLPHHK